MFVVTIPSGHTVKTASHAEARAIIASWASQGVHGATYRTIPTVSTVR